MDVNPFLNCTSKVLKIGQVRVGLGHWEFRTIKANANQNNLISWFDGPNHETKTQPNHQVGTRAWSLSSLGMADTKLNIDENYKSFQWVEATHLSHV